MAEGALSYMLSFAIVQGSGPKRWVIQTLSLSGRSPHCSGTPAWLQHGECHMNRRTKVEFLPRKCHF